MLIGVDRSGSKIVEVGGAEHGFHIKFHRHISSSSSAIAMAVCRKKKAALMGRFSRRGLYLYRIVHIELDRVRHHAEPVDLFDFQVDI